MQINPYSYPDDLFVNLPGSEAAQTFSVGLATLDYALDLELSALETAGKAEVVSQPKIVTVSGQEASVTSGTTIAIAVKVGRLETQVYL